MSGALTHSPSQVIQQLLVDLGIGTLPSAGGSWPITASQERDKPDNVITVYDTAGVPDGRTMIDGVMQEHYGFQVKIRGDKHSTGYSKASEIQNAIDTGVQNTSVTVGSSVYAVATISRTGSIIALGTEPGSTRNLFTINATVSMRQTT